jgi:hypothetical protein
MKLSPIVLFVYNRPWHTRKTVEALQKNELAKDSLLYIFSDGPKKEEDISKIKEIRDYIKTIKGFKEVKIFESGKNKGLANSVISGVTKIINKHGEVIVLEDDLITSPIFLVYMNKLLNKYKEEKKIYSITGYNFPEKVMRIPKDYRFDVYFNPRAASWSWATWKDRWEKVDWEVKDFENFKKKKDLQKKFNIGGEDMSQMLIHQMEGKIDSWAIRWCYHHFKNKAFCVYPIKSYIDNIGLDGSGIHCGVNYEYQNVNLSDKLDPEIPPWIELNEEVMNNFRKVFHKNFARKIFCRIKKKSKLNYEIIEHSLWKKNPQRLD